MQDGGTKMPSVDVAGMTRLNWELTHNHTKNNTCILFTMSVAAGIASAVQRLGHRLDETGVESQQDRDITFFSTTSRLALGPLGLP